MRFARTNVVLSLCLVLALSVSGQQNTATSPQRDPQAIAVLQSAIAAMGGTVPTDSAASGNVVIVAGSKIDSGAIRILTRGTDQSSELTQTSEDTRAVTFSKGRAREAKGATGRSLPLELAVTSQSPVFPLPFLAGALGERDEALQYEGLDMVDGENAHHIRFWNSYSSAPELQSVAEFTVKDIWVSAKTWLPLKLSFQRREAQGAAPRIPVVITYSDYRSVSGVLYPFLIQQSFNGTPWATITIQSVKFNASLNDSDFPVR